MVLPHGCDKVLLSEAQRQNIVYMLVINDSAVCVMCTAVPHRVDRRATYAFPFPQVTLLWKELN